jgi:Flp pilus assembly protein TadD
MKKLLVAAGFSMFMAATAQAQPARDRLQPDIAAESVAQFDVARRMQRDGNLKGAETTLRELTEREPAYFNANYRLGLLLADQGRYPEAVTVLERTRAIRDEQRINDATVLNSLGWAYLLGGDAASAERWLLEAKANENMLSADSRAKVYNNLGYLYMTTGRYPQARAVLETADKTYGSTFARDNLKTLNKLQQSVESPKSKAASALIIR